jgi:hypothetical protein
MPVGTLPFNKFIITSQSSREARAEGNVLQTQPLRQFSISVAKGPRNPTKVRLLLFWRALLKIPALGKIRN